MRASQLPDVVPGRRRSSIKPHSWYATPQHLARMLELAKPVLRSEGAILKWARQPNEHLGGQSPIGLIDTDEGAAKVFNYIETYIRDRLQASGDGIRLAPEAGEPA